LDTGPVTHPYNKSHTSLFFSLSSSSHTHTHTISTKISASLPPWPHSSTLSSSLASLPPSPLPSPLAPPPPSSRSASASDSDQPSRDLWQPPLPKSPHTPCALCARLRIPSSMVSFLLLSFASVYIFCF